jgi:hypothetical protein
MSSELPSFFDRQWSFTDHDFGQLDHDGGIACCSRCPALVKVLLEPLTVDSTAIEGGVRTLEMAYKDGGPSPWFADPPPCIGRGQEGYVPWWYWTTRPEPGRARRSRSKEVLAMVLSMALSL